MNNYRKIKYQKIIYKYKTEFGNNQKKKKNKNSYGEYYFRI